MKKCRRTCKQRGGWGYTFTKYMKTRLGDVWVEMVENHAKEKYKIICSPIKSYEKWVCEKPANNHAQPNAEKELNKKLTPELDKEDNNATAKDAVAFDEFMAADAARLAAINSAAAAAEESDGDEEAGAEGEG
jgi:hypothetical protein